MTMARGFRDTVPMDLLQGLPAMRSVPVLESAVGGDGNPENLEYPDGPEGLDGPEGSEVPEGAVDRAGGLPLNRSARGWWPRGALLLPDLARALMKVAAAAAAAVTVLFLLLGAAGGSAEAGLLSAPWALLVVAAVGVARLPESRQGRAITATMVFMALLVSVTAWVLGLGLASPTLSVLGLLVCAVCVMAGWHAGMAVAAASLLGIGAVAVASWPAGPASGLNLPALQLGTHLVALVVGMACGTLVSRALSRSVLGAREVEQRFSRLLALAADAYWELDQDYRLVSVTPQSERSEALNLNLDQGLGSVPWELPPFGCDAGTLDDLLADMDGRNAFHNRPISWTRSNGDTLQLLVSGEPRFDRRGVFTGFWGVARDVTDVVGDQLALQATEARYHELFSRIPTPLVVHRELQVVDANPAALRLLGYSHRPDLLGADLMAFFEAADARDRMLQGLEELARQPLGTALPVADFKLRANGRLLAVRATSVGVQAPGGPAVLSIFIDDTERLAADEAARRSETMLSHLVTTSADPIMVLEAPSGRLVMVNQAFEKITGYVKKTVLGRLAEELPLWADDNSRSHLQALLAQAGNASLQPSTLLARDGTVLTVQVSSARFAMGEREYMVLNVHDTTERERARKQHETIVTHASIGIAVTRHGRFEQANPHFERLFGAVPGALAGQSLESLWPDTPAWAGVWTRHREQIDKGQPVSFETTARRLDGSSFVAFVRARSIDPEHAPHGGTAWIVEDVTERRHFEQTLARARDDAEAASRAKTAFLSNTSHELRTPLNGLIGLIGLAREPHTTEAQRSLYLQQIADNAHALASIINDILDVAKIEAGKLLLEAAVFDLGKLLLTLQTTFAPLAQASRLSLHFDLEPDVMGSVQGDALRVRQMLSNYLANAIKFTPAGQVRVRVYRLPAEPGGKASDRVRFEVHDTGPGLSPAVQAQLFKPFSQADQSTTRRFGGTGLGLSINRELASLMGGAVGVISDVGQGCTFWAELPLPARLPVQPATPKPSAGSLQNMRVLMVEDNPVNMLIAVAMLERWGVVVTQADNGRDAVQAVREAAAAGQAFDAVLMDVQMPVMSGHEATRELRAMPVGRDLPIIALTAAALVSEREEALRAGMNDFLTKPIDAEKLRNALQRCCAAFV